MWNLPYDLALDRDPTEWPRRRSRPAVVTCSRCKCEIPDPTPVQTHCHACIQTILAEAKAESR